MKIGFVGTGNMGGSILKGYVKAKPDQAENVYVYNHHQEKAEALAAQWKVQAAASIEELVQQCDIVLMAVKPYTFAEIMPQVAMHMDESKALVSIAAGITIEYLESVLPEKTPVVRIMPNTPALVGEAMSSVSPNSYVTEAILEAVLELFRSVGRAEVTAESMIDAVIGVSGSSPAYVYMFMEALADGAVMEGMPRSQAYQFAAQAVLGAAKMLLETGLHPGELKDQVCSPGGTTIAAVAALEESGFRSAVIKAVHTSAEKSREMSK